MGEKPGEVAMSHACSFPAIAAVSTPQATEVCAYWTLHNPHRHLDTEGNRVRWKDSCTVPIEAHLQKILSADDRSPHIAFSRNGTLANGIAAARGEAALKKTELAACAGRLVLRQRAVAYAAIGTTMPALGGINNAMHASRRSLHVEDTALFLSATDWREQLSVAKLDFLIVYFIY